MKKAYVLALVLLTASYVEAQVQTAETVIAKMMESDPWGLGAAIVKARAILKDKQGSTSELVFVARSRRHDPPFSKSLVRFTGPADIAGAGFLQIQNRSQDDERFLFLPELKRARRISGRLRGDSFMGTDFSFADLDRRDFREGKATLRPDESIGKSLCYRVDVEPSRSDSPYSRVESWIRKEGWLPLKMLMYDRSGALQKVFSAGEVKRVKMQWFITRSKVSDVLQGHSTELVLEEIVPASVSDEEFSVRNLEKL